MQRLFAKPQTLDKDQVIHFAIADGAGLAEQGIVSTGNNH
jgi:hypothetical protein